MLCPRQGRGLADSASKRRLLEVAPRLLGQDSQGAAFRCCVNRRLNLTRGRSIRISTLIHSPSAWVAQPASPSPFLHGRWSTRPEAALRVLASYPSDDIDRGRYAPVRAASKPKAGAKVLCDVCPPLANARPADRSREGLLTFP